MPDTGTAQVTNTRGDRRDGGHDHAGGVDLDLAVGVAVCLALTKMIRTRTMVACETAVETRDDG